MKQPLRRESVTVFCALALLTVLALPSQGGACVELVWELPEGPAAVVDFDGERTVFAGGRMLTIADLKEPARPAELGKLVLPESGIRAVELVGDHAFTAMGRAGLKIVDFSDPATPTLVGSFIPEVSDEDIEVVDVTVVGAYAYLAENVRRRQFSYARLQIVDVSDPSRPLPSGSVERWGRAEAIAAVDDVIYLGRSDNVRLYDVSQPERPIELTRIVSGVDVRGLEVADDTLWVLRRYHATLDAYDVTDPRSPTKLSGFEVGFDYPSGLAVVDGLAVVVSLRDGLKTIDVSDPVHPEAVGGLDVPAGNQVGVAARGSIAVVAAGGGGLRIVELSHDGEPIEIGVIDTPGSADYITVAGDLAVVSSAWSGPGRLFDISDPRRPVELGRLPVELLAGRVVIEGSRIYAMAVRQGEAQTEKGLSIIDISEPPALTEVGFAPLDFWPADIDVHWPNAFVVGTSNSFSGLRVIDVGNPGMPVVVGSLELGGNVPGAITVDGHLAYVGRHACPWAHPSCYSSLQVVGVSDPRNPTEMGFTPGGPWSSLTVHDEMIFGSWFSGMRITDCRDPTTPVVNFSTSLDEAAHSVALDGRTAVVTTSRPMGGPEPNSVDVFDVRSPWLPRRIGTHEVPGSAVDAGVSEDHVFVADGYSGIVVFDISACGGPVSRRPGDRVKPLPPASLSPSPNSATALPD